MRTKPERLAWIILNTAFGIFCSLSILIPASIYWYAMTTTVPLETELTSVRDTVFIGNSDTGPSSSVVDGSTIALEENLTVSTDDTSQAILTFADDSSLTLYSDTTITLHQAQEPRFGFSSRPTQIDVEVDKGRVRATASRNREDLTFDIKTPQAVVELGQGSFSIEVGENGTQVTTRLGQANVISGERSVLLNQGQRAVVGPETPISEPLPAAQNLLSSSTFTLGEDSVWQSYTIDLTEDVTTTATTVIYQNRPVLNLRSEGEDNIHTEVGVTQIVERNVRDFQSLRLFAEVRLIYQSLPAGGQAGSEFPIMLHLAYKDDDGNDRDWFHGFYYEPKPPNYILYNDPNNSNEQIARYIWYPYESDNLLTTLGPAKPVYIKSVRIYASGWIYDSMVANISLLAEE
jgi:hypothetical protein